MGCVPKKYSALIPDKRGSVKRDDLPALGGIYIGIALCPHNTLLTSVIFGVHDRAAMSIKTIIIFIL